MNYEKTKKRNKLILIALLLMISLGYALLNANLRINGTSKIKNSSWDIHWNNVQVNSDSVSVTTGDKAAVITPGDTTEVTYEVSLSKPGDFYEFTVDAVNAGSIDAMIDVITSTYKIGEGEVTTITSSNLPAYLDYSVSYSDGTALAENQELNAGDTETYKVRVEYKKDIENNQLVGTDQSIVFSFAVDYVQKDDNAIAVNHQTVGPVAPVGNYVVSNTVMYIGEAIPDGVNVRSTPELAMADWASLTGTPGDTKPFYLKHTIENDIITESYVEFVITDALKTKLKTEKCTDDNYPNSEEKAACKARYDALVNGTYTLRGGVNENNLGEGNQPIYESNVNTMKQALGASTTFCVENSQGYFCQLNGLEILSHPNGGVYVGDGGTCDCHWDSGESRCYY